MLWCQTVTINTNQWQINETVRRQKRDRTVKMFVLLSFDSLTSSQQTFLNRWICKSVSTQYQNGAILNHSNTEALLTVFPKYRGLVIPTWRALWFWDIWRDGPKYSTLLIGLWFWFRFLTQFSLDTVVIAHRSHVGSICVMWSLLLWVGASQIKIDWFNITFRETSAGYKLKVCDVF